MGIISGIGGAVNGHHTVRNWTIDESADVQKYNASNTKGGPGRLDGNTDWSGSFQSYGHTPAVLPGAGFTFTGSIDGSIGVTGTALCDSIEITIDIEAGAIIQHTVSFSGNSALERGAAVVSDTVVPSPPTSIGCKVEVADPAAVPSYASMLNVRTVTITIEADNQEYVSSETSGGKRRTAGNVDASVSISVYESDLSNLPDVNDVQGFRIFVNDAIYWEFEWMVFGEASGIEVDREGAGLVGATLNAQFTGFTDISAVPTEGSITDPGTNVFWPAA